MSVDPGSFKNAMRYLTGAVTIVTTGDDSERRGLTATAVCSLSADPPRLLACINRNGSTFDLISSKRTLGINILSSGHRDLAMRFAGMTDIGDVDRFEEGDWIKLTSGAPILDSALTSFDCRVETAIDVGTHAIIIAEIVGIKEQTSGDPLVYAHSDFKTVRSLTRSVEESVAPA
jgi:flavin reductase (DIM6/NTAB) family NADH-FMN oxidoreductase RutF